MGGGESKPAKVVEPLCPGCKTRHSTAVTCHYSVNPVPQPSNVTYAYRYDCSNRFTDGSVHISRGGNSHSSSLIPLCPMCNTRHSTAAGCPSSVNTLQTPRSVPSVNQSSTRNQPPTTSNDFVFVPPSSSRTAVSEAVVLCPRCITWHSPFIECPVLPKRNLDKPVQEYQTCPNKIYGCGEHYTTTHYETCRFKKTGCPLGKYLDNCKWEGGKCKLNGHINNAHPNNIIYKLDTENKKTTFSEDVEDWDIHVINHEDQTFVFYMKVCHPWFYTAVQLIGSEADAKLWTYKINMYTKNKKGKNIILSEACTSIDENIVNIFALGKCGAIPLHVIRNYVTNQTQITFKLKIFKFVKKQNPRQNDNNANRRN